jgi:hypothetical protein
MEREKVIEKIETVVKEIYYFRFFKSNLGDMATSGRRNDPAFRRKVVQKVAKSAPNPAVSHIESEVFHPEAKQQTHHKVHLRRWQKPMGFKRSKALDMVFILLLAAGVAAFIGGLLGSSAPAADIPAETEQPAEDGEGEAASDQATESESDVALSARDFQAAEEPNEGSTPADAQNVITAGEVESTEVKAEIRRRKGDFIIPCWIVAYSANADKQTANVNFSTLEALGYDAGQYFIPKYFKDGRQLYKVYVGPYKSQAEAEVILPRIQELQPDAYVMKIDE